MTSVTYREFRALVETRAWWIYNDRGERVVSGDTLQDRLKAEQALGRDYRLIIIIGICGCSLGRYAGVFCDREFLLRGIPCVFSEVAIDEKQNEEAQRRKLGCHVFLDNHGSIFVDLMGPISTDNGRIITSGRLYSSSAFSRQNDREKVFEWFTHVLDWMVAVLPEVVFQNWLKIEPATA